MNFHKQVSSVGESPVSYNQLRESHQGKLPISCQFRMTSEASPRAPLISSQQPLNLVYNTCVKAA